MPAGRASRWIAISTPDTGAAAYTRATGRFSAAERSPWVRSMRAMPVAIRTTENSSTTALAKASTALFVRGASFFVTWSNPKWARCSTASEAPRSDAQMKQKRESSSLQGFG